MYDFICKMCHGFSIFRVLHKVPFRKKNESVLVLTSLSAVTSYEMCTGGSRGEYVFQFACMDDCSQRLSFNSVWQ